MSIALVQEADAASSSVTLGANATAGNTLIVAVACLGPTPATGVAGVTLGGSPDNFTLVSPGPSAQDTTSPNDWLNVSVWADANCAGGSTAIAVTGTGVVAAWAFEFSGLSGAPDVAQVLAVNTYQDSWLATTAETTVAGEAWVAVVAAANQVAAETISAASGNGWTLENAYSGTSGSYDWGAISAYQTVNTVGVPSFNGSFSKPSMSVTAIVTFGMTLPTVPSPPAVAGTPLAGGVSVSGGNLHVANTVNAGSVNAGSPVSNTTTPVGLVPTNVKTGNYTAKPGDFVLVQASATKTVVITFPAGPPDQSLIAVKLVLGAAGQQVAVLTSGTDVFDSASPSPIEVNLNTTGATFTAEYKAAVGTWYIQSASYTQAAGFGPFVPGTPAANTPLPADLGFATWSYDPAYLSGTFSGAALPSGSLVLIQCPVRATTFCSNVRAWITAAGSGLTGGQNFVGVYSSAGTRLATSADVTTNFGSTGLFTTSWTTVTIKPPYVWAAFLANGTTPPSLACTGNQTAAWANGVLPGLVSRYGTVAAGSSLPSSFSVISITPAAPEYWAALY